MSRIAATLIAGLLATPVFADGHAVGDATKGEKGFNKCKSCHMIESADGETIVKGGRTGPNLYGVIGRQAGTVEGFRYGDDLVAAGEAGLVWDAENFLTFIEDPRTFLREYLDDSKAKSKMTLKLKSGGEDILAFLVSVGPEATN